MTISVKDELMTALEASGMPSNTATDVATKQRNIAMILAFYGFGKRGWPTLEDLADEFALGTGVPRGCNAGPPRIPWRNLNNHPTAIQPNACLQT